jgi:hypothetical protein
MSLEQSTDLVRQVYEMKCAIRDMSEKLKAKDFKIIELQGFSKQRQSTGCQTEACVKTINDISNEEQTPILALESVKRRHNIEKRRLETVIGQLRLELMVYHRSQ